MRKRLFEHTESKSEYWRRQLVTGVLLIGFLLVLKWVAG